MLPLKAHSENLALSMLGSSHNLQSNQTTNSQGNRSPKPKQADSTRKKTETATKLKRLQKIDWQCDPRFNHRARLARVRARTLQLAIPCTSLYNSTLVHLL